MSSDEHLFTLTWIMHMEVAWARGTWSYIYLRRNLLSSDSLSASLHDTMQMHHYQLVMGTNHQLQFHKPKICAYSQSASSYVPRSSIGSYKPVSQFTADTGFFIRSFPIFSRFSRLSFIGLSAEASVYFKPSVWFQVLITQSSFTSLIFQLI